MSRTLPLVESLLALARNFQHVGRDREAIDLFRRLTTFRELTPAVAEEVHSRLAELHGKRANFRKARRHLTAALTLQPLNADYHHRLALLIESDSDASLDRAGYHYRQAVRHARDSAAYWTDYGVYLLDTGEQRRGAKALARAFRLAGDDAALVGEIADALRQAGLWRRAGRIVQLALFRNAGDRRFRDLWQRHQFALLHKDQRRRQPARTKEALQALLPFVRLEGVRPQATLGGKTIRFDQAATDRGEPNAPKLLPKTI